MRIAGRDQLDDVNVDAQPKQDADLSHQQH